MTDTSATGDMAPASAGRVESPPTPAPAPSTTEPAGATPGSDGAAPLTTETTTAPGPVPYERFTEVNTRMKASEDRWRKAEEGFGEILRMDPQSIRGMLAWYKQAGADPAAFATELINNLASDERYRPQVASQAARILGSLRGVTPKEAPEPQPDLVAENGEQVFSAKQLRAWQEWNSQKSSAAMETRLAEALKPLAELRQQQQAAKVRTQVDQQASQQYQQAQQWHGFKDHESEIAAAFDANPSWDLKDAYLHVLHTKILPTLPAQAKAQVVADLQSKAAASTMNPANATRPTKPDFHGDFKAALEWAHARKG